MSPIFGDTGYKHVLKYYIFKSVINFVQSYYQKNVHECFEMSQIYTKNNFSNVLIAKTT